MKLFTMNAKRNHLWTLVMPLVMILALGYGCPQDNTAPQISSVAPKDGVDGITLDPARAAHDPTLAYDPADGFLYAAFEENIDGHAQIFVKRKRHLP